MDLTLNNVIILINTFFKKVLIKMMTLFRVKVLNYVFEEIYYYFIIFLVKKYYFESKFNKKKIIYKET
jgi:hypothetical protein